MRVNEVVRQVLADAAETFDDPRLAFVTITGVDIDPDLRHGKVFFSTLDVAGAGTVMSAIEGFGEHRLKLQSLINSEMKLKRTPVLEFCEDPAIVNGRMIEEILQKAPRFPDAVDPAEIDTGTETDAE